VDDLAAGFDAVWRGLAAAVADRASPWRTPVLASAGDAGADARVVVLRAVDRDSARLTFFTDVRAAKVAAVAGQPRVAVAAWDPAVQRQLRLRGTAAVATAGASVDAAWAQVPLAARRAYRTLAAPGTPIPASGFAEGGDGHANFAVLTVVLDHVEWLDLAGPAHRRAAFACRDGGWTGSWLVP
jgi:pyridoxine/pyridoxamine 5'-phosphate oxidase